MQAPEGTEPSAERFPQAGLWALVLPAASALATLPFCQGAWGSQRPALRLTHFPQCPPLPCPLPPGPRTSGWPSAQRPLPAPLPQSCKLCARRAEVVHGEVGCRFSYQQDPPPPRSSHGRDPPQEPRGPSWGPEASGDGKVAGNAAREGVPGAGGVLVRYLPHPREDSHLGTRGTEAGRRSHGKRGKPLRPTQPQLGAPLPGGAEILSGLL